MVENNNNKLENGTVRDKIILFLRDGKPKHFTDITKGLKKHDYTINRGLTILIDSNWILKTGKKPKTLYSLDLTRHDVQEYLKRADVAVPSDSEIQELKFAFGYDFEETGNSLIIKKERPSDLFDTIKIHAILDKNAKLDTLKEIEDNVYEDLVFLVSNFIDRQRPDKPFKLIISYNPKKD